jgi:hypothetical protein
MGERVASWARLLTNPSALVGIALFFGFLLLAILRRRALGRWLLGSVLLAASVSLAAGLALAAWKTRGVKTPAAPAAGSTSSQPPSPAAPPAASLNALSAKRLWIIRDRAQITEYDLATFTPGRTLTIPPEFRTNPVDLARKLSFSSQGQFVLAPGESATTRSKFWLWDGHSESAISCPDLDARQEAESDSDADDGHTGAANDLVVRLSADGQRLFWFANHDRVVRNGDRTDESSVITTFHVWQTDLACRHTQEVDSFIFPECKCSTGACEETCPHGSAWAPERGVGDFFFVTHFVPGQLQSQSLASFLYRESGGRWTSTRLPQPLEALADAAAHGSLVIETVPDSGCCGWENESDDSTVLWRDGKPNTLFDEWKSYKNRNYDVSFAATTALVSPVQNLVAITITATQPPGTDIRLSSDGKENPTELEGIRRALGELPAVEVVSADGKRLAFLPRASLVGWLSEKEILIVEDHWLAAYDVVTGAHRKSMLQIPEGTYAFVR